MPVIISSKPTVHVNPKLKCGEVYKITRGYGKGYIFVVTATTKPFIQYIAGSGCDGWDNITVLENSDYVVATLQEV